MSAHSRKFSQIEVESSEWIATISDRTVSLDQRLRFLEWLRQDAEHERVYRTQRAAFQAVAGMSHLLDEERAPAADSSMTHPAPRRRSHRYAAVAAGLTLAAGIGFFVARQWGSGNEYETRTAQVSDIQLADGSKITLGASSRIEVELGEHERRVKLTRGEAYFDVSRDPSRPFLVQAGGTAVRVLGTRFDVHYGEAVRVAVLEGRVEVTESIRGALFSQAKETKKVLGAGEAALAQRSGEIATGTNLKQEDLSAWRQGRLVYVDARLRDIVADINRYYPGHIKLADDSVGEQQLTITFRTDQIDRALEALEGAIPVRAIRASSGEILLARR